MAYPIYRVNNVDFIPFIADEGLQIEENDLDADILHIAHWTQLCLEWLKMHNL